MCFPRGPRKGTPLNVPELLWVNLIMDSLAALALATERPDPRVLRAPPRAPDAPLVDATMAWTIGVQALWQLGWMGWLEGGGAVPGGDAHGEPASLVFNAFILMNLGNILNCRAAGGGGGGGAGRGGKDSTESPVFVGVCVAIVAIQVLIMERGGELFQVRPLSAAEWGLSVAVGAGSLPLAWATQRVLEAWRQRAKTE